MLQLHPPHPAGETKPHPSTVWIDLIRPDDAEIALVEDLTGLRMPTRHELSGIEQSARLSFEEGVLRMAAPVIAGGDTDHPQLSHIGFILTPERLISVRYDKLPMFDAVAGKAGQQAPTSGAVVFAALMQAFAARQADLLEEARARLDGVSHRVFRNATKDPRRAMRNNALMREKMQQLGRISEVISIIRESLLGVDRMIDFATDNASGWFVAETSERLEQACEDIGVLNQFDEHLLSKVQFLLDAVLGFISIEQNDIFKVLTIASVVGIFPTLVAGWYGMNFVNMPELHWAYGYPFGIGVIVASTIAPLLWFKWRGWM